MMKRILLVVLPLAVLLSSCAQATPTVDPAQVQASAIAAASTMIAQTQAALPTATPVPPTPLPTETPLPSPTLGNLPTLQPLASPTTAAAGGDDCNHLMDVGAAGPQASVLIKNDTKGPITFTIGISRKNSFGQCGYISWANIPKMDSIYVGVPYARLNQGDPCYWAYAWVNDPKQQTTVSGGGFCMNNPDKWTFDINYNTIKLTPP